MTLGTLGGKEWGNMPEGSLGTERRDGKGVRLSASGHERRSVRGVGV